MIVPGNLYHLLQSFSSSNTNTLNDNNCCSYVFDVLKQIDLGTMTNVFGSKHSLN